MVLQKNQIQHHHLTPNHKKFIQTTHSSNQYTNKHCKTITHQQTKKTLATITTNILLEL